MLVQALALLTTACGPRRQFTDQGAAGRGCPPAPPAKNRGLTAACCPTLALVHSQTPSVKTACAREHWASASATVVVVVVVVVIVTPPSTPARAPQAKLELIDAPTQPEPNPKERSQSVAAAEKLSATLQGAHVVGLPRIRKCATVCATCF